MRVTLAPVLALAALVTAPAWWMALGTGELSLEVALVRYLVAVGVVWVGCTLVSLLVGAPQRAVVTATETAAADPEAPPA